MDFVCKSILNAWIAVAVISILRINIVKLIRKKVLLVEKVCLTCYFFIFSDVKVSIKIKYGGSNFYSFTLFVLYSLKRFWLFSCKQVNEFLNGFKDFFARIWWIYL